MLYRPEAGRQDAGYEDFQRPLHPNDLPFVPLSIVGPASPNHPQEGLRFSRTSERNPRRYDFLAWRRRTICQIAQAITATPEARYTHRATPQS